ncbi:MULTISPECIES: hypothetical protein [Comamonas]|jgi:hypothetical protein|uniref:Uncharacterized protein n=1 Tax=Comamonas aquatica TaxID=225991 RepID=A0AA42I1H8_9BURK|nr:hypothetical protein [Comamonas aquatica]MDE1554061.1 hypothetical protein [Comamonas aquatica]MDH0200794.1 hypothetical protein [Comamonas aquatica]MDH0364260.1 hypothetical protein [Comamonas aquatica]MDH0380676.1 hypothetical protein [Comamonas aquatica]MDH0429215.1 hypothetical protein [Comamonas aquatica]
MPTESKHKIQKEIDQASERVGALCELLEAAQHNKVSASCIHSILKPIARQLDHAAGAIADASLNHQ